MSSSIGNGGSEPSSSCHSRISRPVLISRATRQTGTGFAPDSETNSKSRANTDLKGNCGHRMARWYGRWVFGVYPGHARARALHPYSRRLRMTDLHSGFVVG